MELVVWTDGSRPRCGALSDARRRVRGDGRQGGLAEQRRRIGFIDEEGPDGCALHRDLASVRQFVRAEALRPEIDRLESVNVVELGRQSTQQLLGPVLEAARRMADALDAINIVDSGMVRNHRSEHSRICSRRCIGPPTFPEPEGCIRHRTRVYQMCRVCKWERDQFLWMPSLVQVFGQGTAY